jgi:erythromycin esterase
MRQRNDLEEALGRLSDLDKLTPEERKKFQAVVQDTLSSISTSHERLRRSHSTREIAFQAQMLNNLPAMLERATVLSANKGNLGSVLNNNFRDRQMAENLVWLAKQRYPDRKIIVWVASFHIMRNSPSIEIIDVKQRPGLSYKGLVTMGHTVYERIGDEAYTIGFTAYQGKFGSAERPREVGMAPDGSLDALLHQVGSPYLFLDFRSLRRQPEHWLHQSIVARPLGYGAMRANWTEIFDAMIFTDTMFPVSTFKELK